MRQLHQPRYLPDFPNLDQLRHQARDLLRAAQRGDPEALQRVRAVSPDATLHAAQLALAREYGFGSWASLKDEVERRRSHTAAKSAEATPGDAEQRERFSIRPVSTREELTRTFDVIGALMAPPITHTDRRFGDLATRFATDRSLMLLVRDAESPGTIVGGALAFRTGAGGATLRILGLDPAIRRRGLGRRLLETLEIEAARLGVRQISLGADERAKGFYARLGYAGRGAMMYKGLPLHGRFLEARLRKLDGGIRST